MCMCKCVCVYVSQVPILITESLPVSGGAAECAPLERHRDLRIKFIRTRTYTHSAMGDMDHRVHTMT